MGDAYGNIVGAIGIPTSPSCKRGWPPGLWRADRFLAGEAINIGQNAPDFVVTLAVEAHQGRDPIARRAAACAPQKFTIVIRAMVKGNVVVAALQ